MDRNRDPREWYGQLKTERFVDPRVGDNFSKWEDIKYSISAMVNFNIFGIKMVGVDVCGFNGDTEEPY